MAGVSMKDIKLRIRSMESTKQITKAMQMVAASKLRHAQERIENSRPYFEILLNTVNDIMSSNGEFSSPYTTQREVKRICYVVIAGDRGLAGGYNSNVLKMVYGDIQKSGVPAVVVPIGKKAVEFFENRNVPILTKDYAVADIVSVGDCFGIARETADGFLRGDYDEIRIGWTNFTSVMSQSTASMKIIPLQHIEDDSLSGRTEVEYEPSAHEAFESIVPEYIGGFVYGALCESVASELASRRNAMDAATQNAEDMIDDLSLRYNRARQGAITQEITEIVAGAEN